MRRYFLNRSVLDRTPWWVNQTWSFPDLPSYCMCPQNQTGRLATGKTITWRAASGNGTARAGTNPPVGGLAPSGKVTHQTATEKILS